MPPLILPFDDHYYGLTALVTVVLQLVCFAVAYLLQFDKITDLAGSANFILISLLTYFLSYDPANLNARAITITALSCITRFELAGFLLYRVLRRGGDERFDAIRMNFFPFLGFWVFQMLWAWVVSLPVTFVNSDRGRTPLGAADAVGVAMFGIGFIVQVLADFQKDAFRAKPENKGKWCDVGVWKWSRHPNYFGEIFMWWGIFVLATPQIFVSENVPMGWGTIASPVFTMMILLLLSGMPTAEGDNQLRFMKTPGQAAQFATYRNRTSPIIPLPPFLYAVLPTFVKAWLLFEWKMYAVKGDGGGGGGGAGGSSGEVSNENTLLNAAPALLPKDQRQ